jgi:hypothetical protein
VPISSKYHALCDLPKITEEEYFQREFSLNLEYKASDRSFDDNLQLIVSDNPKNWSELLSSAPKERLTFILIGNETYEPWKYEFLNQFKSIQKALIYNPPRKCPSFNILKSALGNILDGGLAPTGRPGSVFRDFRTSQYTKRKLEKIKIDYRYLELPQGYCNSFIKQLSLLSDSIGKAISDGKSPFSNELQTELKKHIHKTKTFTYLGQLGHHRRATCLRVAKKDHAIDVPSKQGFGGLEFDGDSTYLSNLLVTKFPLVPPGAFNNYNHRYSETLLTGGIPAILAQNSLDPSSNENWSNSLTFPASHSFRFLLKRLSRLSDSEFSELQQLALTADAKRIEKVRVFLRG